MRPERVLSTCIAPTRQSTGGTQQRLLVRGVGHGEGLGNESLDGNSGGELLRMSVGVRVDGDFCCGMSDRLGAVVGVSRASQQHLSDLFRGICLALPVWLDCSVSAWVDQTWSAVVWHGLILPNPVCFDVGSDLVRLT